MTERSGFLEDQAEIQAKIHELEALLQVFADKFGIVPVIGNVIEYNEPVPEMELKIYHVL